MQVAVIGANGFIARHVCLALSDAGHDVTAIVRRREIKKLDGTTDVKHIDDAGPKTDWAPLVSGVDAVLHLVSPPDGESENAVAAYRWVRDGTLALARVAAAHSVKRFIFVSTIKVNGEDTETEPFRPSSPPKPEAMYGQIKLETEKGLAGISKEVALPITVARPGAVYGPGGVGNIHLLAKLLSLVPGRLIPLDGIKNKRSLIHVENLASALVCCVEDDSHDNRLFLLHDGAAVSTSELCRLILLGLDKPTTLLPDPFQIVRRLTSSIAPKFARRLYGSLEIDDNSIADILGWEPPLSTKTGLRHAVSTTRDRR